MIKVCVVTGTRAEYGLLKLLIKEIANHPELELQLFVTGTHLSSEFGYTVNEIEDDGFKISKKIEIILSSDTSTAIGKSVGLGVISFSEAFFEYTPDFVFLLGDRYELLAASTAALIARIPIGHIAGGETTLGAYDDAIRHSITKMSWWHFVEAEKYRKRIIQLGEDPKRVFLVGGLGVDAIKNTVILDKKTFEKNNNFKFGKNILVTYHPVTLDNDKNGTQFEELLVSLKKLKDTKIIFTFANSDNNGRIINQKIKDFVSKNPSNFSCFHSLGQLNYYTALNYVDAVVGNSSSGILEAPSFKIGTINIGDRQKGRLQSESVINCEPNSTSINNALKKSLQHRFSKKLKKSSSPYGKGNASSQIIKTILNEPIPKNIKKLL